MANTDKAGRNPGVIRTWFYSFSWIPAKFNTSPQRRNQGAALTYFLTFPRFRSSLPTIDWVLPSQPLVYSQVWSSWNGRLNVTTGSRAGTPSPSAGGRPHSGRGRWLEENTLGRKSSCRRRSRTPFSPVWMTRLRGPAPGCHTRPPTHWTCSKLGGKRKETGFDRQPKCSLWMRAYFPGPNLTFCHLLILGGGSCGAPHHCPMLTKLA